MSPTALLGIVVDPIKAARSSPAIEHGQAAFGE
jgi:hypothetical protein